MSDDPKKPGDPAAESTPPDEEERPKLREVSEDELKEILTAHERWVESDGKEGEQADLQGVDLRRADFQEADLRDANLRNSRLVQSKFERADLRGANLEEANLYDANLQEANLSDANLQGANFMAANLRKARLKGTNLKGCNFFKAILEEVFLRETNLQEVRFFGANLRGANLIGANLQKADLAAANLNGAILANATLREARLQDADLTDVRGLLGEQLAGANVSGAKLPDDIAKFEGLDHVTEISKNARKIFLSMLLGCAYSWLTIATTTDARLLNSSASSPLPIIGTEIPIFWFYWAAPFILGALYVYLHLYLQRLWESLAGLPARFQDGKRLDERAYPWLLNGLVRRHFKLLKEERPPIARLEEWVTIFLGWWVVPGTLFGFWLRYLPRHEWVGTWLHIGLAVATILAATVFYSSAARTLRGDERQPFRWKTPWQDRRSYQTVGVVLVGFMLWGLSYGAINGVRSPDYTRRHSLIEPPRLKDMGLRRLVPRVFALIGYSPFAALREADVSTKSENWRGAEEDIALVTGANLKGSDLRYADAGSAFLVRADLREASLQKAYLVRANLQGANLFRANLKWADLRGTNLKGADLRFANLQGTDLTFARNLTMEQLDEACGDKKTRLPVYLVGYKMKPCPEEPK